jgi:deoxycytidylate deaminase
MTTSAVKTAKVWLRLTLARDLQHENQCPRATVKATTYSNSGVLVGFGVNTLHKSFNGCSCNDGVDTNKKGSTTCKSVHAELAALIDTWSKGILQEEVIAIAVTRPPCRICCATLLETSIQTIITTDEFEDRDGSKEVWEKAEGTWITLNKEEEL